MTKWVKIGRLSVCVLFATALCAAASIVWSEFTDDIVILGEYHDNPRHHQHQQNAVNDIGPKAVVFEMLTPDEARKLADVPRNRAAMRAATEGFHWTNIADYAAILSRSTEIVGAALPQADVRAAFSEGAGAVFGDQAAVFGLLDDVPEPQKSQRLERQFDAHCAAMPLETMGGMMEAQRLRDAVFARTVLQAIETYGTPVVFITGNGHARKDWGVPYYLARVRPDLDVMAIGQGEEGIPPAGVFDVQISDAPRPDRPDPCAAFQ